MSEPFVVEIWGEPAGIVLKEGNAFRFHAIARPFFVLDGTQFTTPGHARLAAARLHPARSAIAAVHRSKDRPAVTAASRHAAVIKP
jgi:hypothetical protein